MAITNIGSINLDNVYRVDAFAAPGETLLVSEYSAGLGGKGANQSIAAARAGSQVYLIGAVGSDGDWTRDTLHEAGVDIQGIRTTYEPTGHAVIQVNSHGENSILVYSGANLALTHDQISDALQAMLPGDWLLFQNETNLTREIAEAGRGRSAKICYCAAPFIAELALPILPYIDLLVANEVEVASLAAHFGGQEDNIPVPSLLVTRGGRGASYVVRSEFSYALSVPSFGVTVIDTTGAGDTFLGYFLSSLDTGLDAMRALRRASAAAALQVSKPGASDAIPTGDEVSDFLATNPMD